VFPIIRTNKKKDAIPQKIGEIDIKISCKFEKQKQNLNRAKIGKAPPEIRGKCKNFF